MKKVWRVGALALLVVLAVMGSWVWAPKPPISVGVLHSLTGTLAASEKPVVEATLMAIEEVNQAGGVLARPLVPVVMDGASDERQFAAKATELLTGQRVPVIFGCWTSASRKRVKPIVEKAQGLLFYPVQYEGLERSPNIIYMGAAPNQQIVPAVRWALNQLGTRLFLVGSDYVFPRTAHAIMRAQVAALGGQVVGEAFLPLGSTDVATTVARIAQLRPDAVLNTINGDTNVAFFRELRQRGIASWQIPTVSFSLGEVELPVVGLPQTVGDYAAWNYFQSLNRPTNREFVKRFQQRYGSDRVVSDPMEAAYLGVKIWAQAANRMGSIEPSLVGEALAGASIAAPQGPVYIDPENNHAWKTVRIGQIQPNGQFDVVWDAGRPTRPLPYPIFKSEKEWDDFLTGLYQSWGGNWANLGS
ncbi:MAG TPA: urea ABC transporter substrate-binding protein [Cyanobacteria bacterium UBA8156]|jgi:urea transport system substrate-binding protein|nr:urea ABC transporter substrate-binding protein [Cyanobacteria bacterium UBA8156]